MKFAPLNVPFERRKQMLGVLIALHEAHLPFFIGTYICYRLFWTQYYWITLAYVAWYILDFNQEERGGRRWQRFRYQWPAYWAAEYLSLKFVKTCDLPTDRNYVIAHHPHGIYAAAAVLGYGTEACDFAELFPGIVPYLLTLRLNFILPFTREIALWFGLCSSSKKALRYILTNQGKGNAAIVVVGGAQESLDCRSGSDYILTLRRRKGFILEALMSGSDIVPSFAFGENELYHQVDNPPGSTLRKFQLAFKQISRFTIPLICGRGIFQYSFGYVPHRVPITCVVGGPIRVERVLNPTREQIDEVRNRYIEALTRLFEEHKHKYGHGDRKLIIN